MVNWEISWNIIKATFPIWEMFLFSDEIYFPLHFDKTFENIPNDKIQLSAGKLCLSLNFLSVWMDYDEDVQKIVNADYLKIQSLLKNWQANWQKKVFHEIPVRHRQLNRALSELRKKIDISKSQFNQFIELRLMVGLLNEVLPVDQKMIFTGEDQLLRSLTKPDSFFYQGDFSKYYDSETYWYLYRTLRQE